MTQETQGPRTIGSEYDLAGRRTKLIHPDPGGSFFVNYDWDVGGSLTKVRVQGATSGAGVVAQFSYDDWGRRTQLLRGNGGDTGMSYGWDLSLMNLYHHFTPTTFEESVTRAENAAGQLASRTHYNAAFAWTEAEHVDHDYTHNRRNQTTSNTETPPVGTPGTFNLGYNAAGSLASAQTSATTSTLFAYDADRRLTKVTEGGVDTNLLYDPIGRLRRVQRAASARQFGYDGTDIIAEYDDATGAVTKRYVHGPGTDEPLVEYTGNGTTQPTWLVPDELGSIVARVGPTGTYATNRYDEYGLPASGNAGLFSTQGRSGSGRRGSTTTRRGRTRPRWGGSCSPTRSGRRGG